MVKRRVSVPEGVERMRLRWEIVRSVLLMYIGSQDLKVSIEGICGGAGTEEVGVAAAFSGELPGGGRP